MLYAPSALHPRKLQPHQRAQVFAVSFCLLLGGFYPLVYYGWNLPLAFLVGFTIYAFAMSLTHLSHGLTAPEAEMAAKAWNFIGAAAMASFYVAMTLQLA